MKAIAVVLIALAVFGFAEESEADKPKVKPVILKQKKIYSYGLDPKVVIVPKGDHRARGPAPAGCPKCECNCAKKDSPFVSADVAEQPKTPASRPAALPFLAGAPCTDNQGKPGLCGERSQCKGRLTAGKCAGPANIMCCSQVPSTPARPTTPSTPAPANGCSYANAPKETVVGNGNVKYTATLVKREHLTNPSQYGVATNAADNRIVVNTGTACAFERMYNAAKKAGVDLRISSAFRTLGRQQYFYNCMITKKCNGGNLAATPGTSNHGQGLALDLNTNCGGQGTRKNPAPHPPAACKNSAVYRWLYANAATYGFVRRVQIEPWHFEYRPGQKQPAWAW